MIQSVVKANWVCGLWYLDLKCGHFETRYRAKKEKSPVRVKCLECEGKSNRAKKKAMDQQGTTQKVVRAEYNRGNVSFAPSWYVQLVCGVWVSMEAPDKNKPPKEGICYSCPHQQPIQQKKKAMDQLEDMTEFAVEDNEPIQKIITAKTKPSLKCEMSPAEIEKEQREEEMAVLFKDKPSIKPTTSAIKPKTERSLFEETLGAFGLTNKWAIGYERSAHKSVERTPYKYTPPDPYKQYEGYAQLSHQTKLNRFPILYQRAQELQPNAKRVLSLGCSTGEEIIALAEKFPNAELYGVDIDHYSIQTARRNNKLPNAYFFDQVEGLGQFDLITCFMVLFGLEVPVPKDRWLSVMEKLDKHAAPNAVVMCYTSEFPLEEVFTAEKYEPLNVYTRIHNKNGKEYYNGYYRKRK